MFSVNQSTRKYVHWNLVNYIYRCSCAVRSKLVRLTFDFRVVLARSLKYCQITVEKLKHAGIEVMWHGKRHNEGSHYCAQCEVSG